MREEEGEEGGGEVLTYSSEGGDGEMVEGFIENSELTGFEVPHTFLSTARFIVRP